MSSKAERQEWRRRTVATYRAKNPELAAEINRAAQKKFRLRREEQRERLIATLERLATACSEGSLLREATDDAWALLAEIRQRPARTQAKG